MNAMHISKLRVYISATNLLTFTKYSGYDPAVTLSSIFSPGNDQITYPVPRNILGIGAQDLINIEFKWADNYQKDENGNLDVFSFYEDGDAAPMGRLTYVVSEVK